MRVANHREERHVRRFAVNGPARVEHFVAAVLGVRLREHQQLNIRRVTAHRVECVREVIDLVVGERKT